MKKTIEQPKSLKLDNISDDPAILEILRLSEIQSIYYTTEDTATASEKKYRFTTILKGRKDTNVLCYTYKSKLAILNRLKKILFFLVKHQDKIENEFLVVTDNGIFLSSEIDFSDFNPDTVTK